MEQGRKLREKQQETSQHEERDTGRDRTEAAGLPWGQSDLLQFPKPNETDIDTGRSRLLGSSPSQVNTELRSEVSTLGGAVWLSPSRAQRLPTSLSQGDPGTCLLVPAGNIQGD